MFEHADRSPGDTSSSSDRVSAPASQARSTSTPSAPVLEDARALVGLFDSLASMVPAASLSIAPAAIPAPATSRAPGTRFGPTKEEMAAVSREAEAVNRIRVLEDLKAACAAAQARETAALQAHRHREEAARGVPASKRGRGLGSEIGLARREGQQRGSVHLRQALHLTTDLPNTLVSLQSGRISEEHAAVVERHTHWLPEQARRNVDAAVADRIEGLGIRDLTHETQAAAHREEPEAAAEQYDQAVTTRHVNIKPADYGMAYLTALLPAVEAAACHRALTDQAAMEIGLGDAEGRTLQHVLSDIFVERLTGRSAGEASPVEVQLIMTDTALLAGGCDPAWVPGHGPLPASVARKMLAGAPARGDLVNAAPGTGEPGGGTGTDRGTGADQDNATAVAEARVFLRRLYTSPETGQLVAMDSQRRAFSGKLRQMILLRDNLCRTPYCGGPIRHIDHAVPHREGGPTDYGNGSGLCERCNYTKEHPGWSHRATPDRLQVTTPTGHHYTSRSRPFAPPLSTTLSPPLAPLLSPPLSTAASPPTSPPVSAPPCDTPIAPRAEGRETPDPACSTGTAATVRLEPLHRASVDHVESNDLCRIGDGVGTTDRPGQVPLLGPADYLWAQLRHGTRLDYASAA